MGVVLVFGVLLSGRAARHHLLIDSDGRWRDPLWLAEFLPEVEAKETVQKKRPVLTGPIDINNCSTDSLTLLPGIGPVLAERIALARQEGLRFTAPRELEIVKGIGPALAAKITPWVLFPSAQAPDSTRSPDPPDSSSATGFRTQDGN